MISEKKEMYKGIFCFLFASCQQLPVPFCEFENLCFNGKTSLFFADKLGGASEEGRGYSFQSVKEPIDIQVIPGTVFFLFESQTTKKYLAHFFHLLEHICGLWSFYGDGHSEKVRQIVLAAEGGLEDWQWEGPNEINYHLLQALFPKAEVITWGQFLQQCGDKTLCFERALTSDRALCFTSQECISVNKMLGAASQFISQEAMQRLSERVYAYSKISKEKGDALRITYLKRPSPRALDPKIEELLLNSLCFLGSLRIEDFATLSFSDQIGIIANTDLLISVHGNGLSHILFLPSHAKVMEIFPPSAHALDYRLFADLRGLNYNAVIPDLGFIEREASYRMGAFGNFDLPIELLDIDLFLSKVPQ